MTEPKLVEFRTSDKLTLPGLLYAAPNSKKIAILLHGNGSSSVFYDEGENRDLPYFLMKKGISLLKFNNRGAHIIKKLNIDSKKVKKDRKPFGAAFEIIKECVLDIDAALVSLRGLGYEEFYLIGKSTGANKICVYNHYKANNDFSKYVLVCGGDDTGIYYNTLGKKLFFELLDEAKRNIKNGDGDRYIDKLVQYGEIFSYKGFYDIANPDGDYNCFPFLEVLGKVKISTLPLLRYFKEIGKKSLVIYGNSDEYCWDSVPKLVGILKRENPKLSYQTIKDADHGFNGKEKELAKIISDWLG